MNSSTEDFKKLKEKVQEKVSKTLKIQIDLSKWSMNDIRTFQDDLEKQCKSSVSEKWIYTHFKNDHPKLPRVDVLNLLSQYCGYDSWSHFLIDNSPQQNKSGSFKKIILPLLLLFTLFALAFSKSLWKTKQSVLLFQDAYTREFISIDQLKIIGSTTGNKPTDITSPRITSNKLDSIYVNGTFYKEKSFPISSNMDTLIFSLYPDDYVLMLNFFSRSETTNWQKRKAQLMNVIHEEAKIFQVHPKYQGLEILNKQEFIDRLIIPINTLKNLDIQDIQYKNDQIFRLRFTQNDLAND